jgi:glycosyltransferase involved in cell wall biosynthesis
MIIGIDASRNRSGGAINHLIGILTEVKPQNYNITEIHVWSYKKLLDLLPDRSYIIKHNPPELEKALPFQIFWQALRLNIEAKRIGIDILFTSDASTLCRFKPQVVLSQDLLSYEPGIMKSYGFTLARLRLLLILWIQNSAFRRADGVIFLTNYASEIITKSCGKLKSFAIVNHGVNKEFKKLEFSRDWSAQSERAIECIYVSNADMYKHQWEVIKALAKLRGNGYNLNLKLVGGGSGKAQNLILKYISDFDPEHSFVTQYDFLNKDDLKELLRNSDISIFASSCENMPVTLIESMAAGLPIASSDRGPMPEVLQDGGIYFNPENADSISRAVFRIINEPQLRIKLSERAKFLSENYSWSRCSDETFTYILSTYHKSKN